MMMTSPGFTKHAGGVIKTLLAAGGHEYVGGVGMYVVLALHALGDLLAQTGPAVGAGVLQSHAAGFLQHGVGCGFDLLHGEELRGGHAAGKGDDIGLVGQSQQLTYSGALEKIHSVCKSDH
jgi:hypothetical protein